MSNANDLLDALGVLGLDEGARVRALLAASCGSVLAGTNSTADLRAHDVISLAEYIRTGAVPPDADGQDDDGDDDGDVTPVPVTVVGPPAPEGPNTWQ